jgi:predicted ATP-dependent Lon-type protease
MGDTSARLRDLMMRQGALVIVGPQYLQTTMALVPPGNRKAVFSAAKIDDLEVPDALMLDCSLIFAHGLTWCLGRGVTKPELAKWSDALLAGIVFKPASVPGLEPAEIETPKRSFTADEKTNELILLVQWGPVPSAHVVEVTRALERAYARLSAL